MKAIQCLDIWKTGLSQILEDFGGEDSGAFWNENYRKTLKSIQEVKVVSFFVFFGDRAIENLQHRFRRWTWCNFFVLQKDWANANFQIDFGREDDAVLSLFEGQSYRKI